jgi:hypothetical protein
MKTSKDKISVYYDKEKDGDLKGMIKILSESKGTYSQRSESEIAKMILSREIPKELSDV